MGQQKGIALMHTQAQDIVAKCPICQEVNYCKTLSREPENIHRGKLMDKFGKWITSDLFQWERVESIIMLLQ